MSTVSDIVVGIYTRLVADNWSAEAVWREEVYYGRVPLAVALYAKKVDLSSVRGFTTDVKLATGGVDSVGGYTHAALLAIKEAA